MTSFFRFLRATPSAEWVSVWAATAFALLLLLLMALPAAAQSLVVDPPASFPSELTFTVDIVLESGGLEVKGVETMITFDPGFLHLDEVTPGPWLTGTGQAYFFFDFGEEKGSADFGSISKPDFSTL